MTEEIKLSALQPDHRNANKGTERGAYMVEQSLRKLGAGRSILLDKNGKIIAGNKTAEAAGAIDLDDVVIVRTDGKKLVAVMREDLDLDDDTGLARELAYADNRTGQVSLQFDPDIIAADLEMGVDLGDWFQDWELGITDDSQFAGNGDGQELDTTEKPLPSGVPDTIWPSDNEYGIPMLDITRQADAFDIPVETWGAKGRSNKAGTYHFYTEDYRFNNVWERPYKITDTKPINVVEPNFSIYKDFPVAVAIWRTYQKRWLARYWQSQGIRVFVDLNVNPDYYDINLLGVPDGWQAFATRGYSDRLDYTEIELQQAKDKALGEPVLFMVYGGGKKVKAWCEAHTVDGVVWVSEGMDKAKGKYNEF